MLKVPKLSVYVNKYAKGWDGDPTTFAAYAGHPKHSGGTATLKTLLLHDKYEDDAHFATYHFEGLTHVPRLRKHVGEDHRSYLNWLEAQGHRVRHDVLAFDIDDDDAHANKTPSTAEWRDEFDRRMAGMPQGAPWWYHTTHGAGVV